MPRYIDANKVESVLYGITAYKNTIPLDSAIFNIRRIPTADVVEVVRCKDCKWWKSNFTWNGKEVKVCVKEPYEPVRTEDFYCADGERREDGEIH